MDDRIQKRFDELAEMAGKIEASKSTELKASGAPTVSTPGRQRSLQQMRDERQVIDASLFEEWATSVESLLSRVFGVDDATTKRITAAAKTKSSTPHSGFDSAHAVFRSAKDQYEGGYLFELRNLVHAEVFSDELEQATHFLDQGYKVPSAVIAGTVLETTLRELCKQHPNLQPADKLNTMNDALAKEGVYNKMRADQIRAWAKIRNSAAHGQPSEFEASDVTRMIDGIRDFIANHMS